MDSKPTRTARVDVGDLLRDALLASLIALALALVLVLEGLIPFVSPGGYKNMVQQMAAMPTQSLRSIGLVLMIVGLLLLYFIRG